MSYEERVATVMKRFACTEHEARGLLALRGDHEGGITQEQVRQALKTPEDVAEAFHEAYERLAPQFGYETRQRSAVPWSEVPEDNRRLMSAVAAELLNRGVIKT